MNQKQNISSSLFSHNSLKEEISQEHDIDSKLQRRQINFSNEENFSKIKESAMTNELSLGQNYRDRKFLQKRIKQNIYIEVPQNLKNKLTISTELFEQCQNMEIKISKFSEILSAFNSQEINKKYLGLVGIRKLLLLPSPPIQELLNVGIIQELIPLLDNSPSEFQYEALWVLTMFSSGSSDQVNMIVCKGLIPKIVKFLDSQIEELKCQAIIIIGNLANDSGKIRDLLIKEKSFDKILTVLSSTNQNILIKNCIWAISCFFKVKPIPPYNLVKKSIKMIARAIVILPGDTEFLTEAFFILSYITEHYKDAVNDLFDLDIIPNIIKYLDIDVQYIQLSCLRVIGNIASGNANQTQLLIDWKVFDYLKKTIMNPKNMIRKESAWILSNIAAGTQKQLEMLISSNFLPILEHIIQIDELEIKKECIWAVCNMTSVEKPEYMKKLLDQNILRIICNCLKMNDAKYLAVSLEALGNLLAFGKKNNPEGHNPIVIEFEKMGMCDILEKLQFHPVEIVYNKALRLLETYFETQFMD